MDQQIEQINKTMIINPKEIDLQDGKKIAEYIKSYKKNRIVKAIKVPLQETNHYHKQVKKTNAILDVPNLQKVINCPPSHKLVLVDKLFKFQDIELFPNENGQNHCEIVQYQVRLNYKNFTTQEIFDWFTDGKIPFPNSFQTVGHMAHYNLTPEQIPFKTVIGQITLLKCLNITCVVHKTQKLHNVYRTPTLEMMAGQKNYTVKLKEVGTSFQFDFQKVYWCSRLQQQRDRLLKSMNKGECLADIFCGVGPLAVRAAKKGVFVIANDLNPYGYEYLQHNCKLNKVQKNMICWNMCARQAIKKLYKQKQTFPKQFQEPDHVYMNLPVDAIQFLDVFQNYGSDLNTQKMPLIHVNCFVVADSDQKSKTLLAERIQKVLPGFQQEQILGLNHIKNVTIIMRMYCVSFRLRSKYQKQQKQQKNKQNNKDKQDEQKLGQPKKKIKQNQ